MKMLSGPCARQSYATSLPEQAARMERSPSGGQTLWQTEEVTVARDHFPTLTKLHNFNLRRNTKPNLKPKIQLQS